MGEALDTLATPSRTRSGDGADRATPARYAPRVRAPEAAIGRLIAGKYRLCEVLAVGGMGLVYAATHEGTGRAVAIKLLRSELLTQRDIVRRVSAEARIAVEASHPNVVGVLDAGSDDEGVPYLVLERLYGQPLEALLGEPLPLLTVAQALVPVANALVALHRGGIVHRDIKPANIFLHRDVDGRVTPKLLDFGIAKAVARSSTTLTGAALGTPAYMAPEQALGHHVGGPAADVWSMAVVFAQSLTGRLPFANVRAGSGLVLRSLLGREFFPDVPESVATLLARALAFEPNERPRDMAVFRDELLRALAAIDPQAPWPGDSTVNYCPGEFALAGLIALDVSPPRSAWSTNCASPMLARPRHVNTLTLNQAPVLARAARRFASRPWRALFVAMSISAGLTLFSAGGRERLESKTTPVAERAPEPVRHVEMLQPAARLDTPGPPPPPPGARAPEVEPSPILVASTVGQRESQRGHAPAARAATPRARSPMPAEAPGVPPFRVGPNRAPIIE